MAVLKKVLLVFEIELLMLIRLAHDGQKFQNLSCNVTLLKVYLSTNFATSAVFTRVHEKVFFNKQDWEFD